MRKRLRRRKRKKRRKRLRRRKRKLFRSSLFVYQETSYLGCLSDEKYGK